MTSTQGQSEPDRAAQTSAPTTQSVYAGIVSRTVAILIDGGLLLLSSTIATAVVTFGLSILFNVDTTNTTAAVSALLSWTVLGGLYFTICWSAAGQTLGMRLMGVRVTRESGKPIGLARAFLRLIALTFLIGPLFLGLLLVLVHPKRRGVHDLIAGTVVVYSDD